MKLKLKSTNQLTDGVIEFTFEPDNSVVWTAGQFIHYTLDLENNDERGNERWFTISSPPYSEHVQITTKFFGNKSSEFKKKLTKLLPGDSIKIDKPEGDFIIKDTNANYVFIAGGIGITPFHSILHQLDHEGINLKAILLYGNNNSEIIFEEELERINKNMSNLKINYIIEPERITEDTIKNASANLSDPFYYVSGPERMVEGIKEVLLKQGINENKIVADYFPGYE